MAEYSVEWIRPTVYIDLAGQAVDGFQVRIVLYPWNEARNLKLKEATAELINDAALIEVAKREAVDELTGAGGAAPKKPKKS